MKLRYTSLNKVRKAGVKTILWLHQNQRCALCQRKIRETSITVKGAVVLDHDHISGVVRGLLCHICNLRLGRYESVRGSILEMERYIASPPAFDAPPHELESQPRHVARERKARDRITLKADPEMDAVIADLLNEPDAAS